MAFSTSSIAAIKGDTGDQGPAGTNGTDGAAATIAVGTVTTGAAGSSATVTNSGSSSAATFDFAIPQGAAGTIDLTADQSWTGSQRATIVTDNDGSFDLNAGQNFKCTPTGIVNLTFTNEADGQSGYILLVNGSAYAHTKDDTTVKAPSGLLTDIGAAGTFLISYFSDGTTTYLTGSKALS